MPESDEIIIREYQDGDEAQINLLHNREYGSNRTLEQWRWEFKEGPYGEAIFVVAEYKGKIIGTQALLPIYLSCGEQQFLTAKSEETLVDKEFRGRGLSKKLWGKCWDLAIPKRITLAWGFGYQVTASVKSGFHVVGKLKHAILVIDPTQTYQINKNRIPAEVRGRLPVQSVLLPILRVFTLGGFLWSKTKFRQFKRYSEYQVESITKADGRLDTFWRSFAEKSSIWTIARTSDYLNWRVFQNPNMTSQLLVVTRDNKIQGCVIISKSIHANVGIITDFCTLSENFDETASLLMSSAIESLRSQKVAYADAWYVNSNNWQTPKYLFWLKKAGFLLLPIGAYFMVKPLAEERSLPGKPTSLSPWYITSLFSEGTG